MLPLLSFDAPCLHIKATVPFLADIPRPAILESVEFFGGKNSSNRHGWTFLQLSFLCYVFPHVDLIHCMCVLAGDDHLSTPDENCMDVVIRLPINPIEF